MDSSIKKYPNEMAHIPTPLPDRVVLTWNDDPATTQAVNWRTDVSVKAGLAQLAIANANGRALKPCLLYTSPSPRDVEESRMPSSA